MDRKLIAKISRPVWMIGDGRGFVILAGTETLRVPTIYRKDKEIIQKDYITRIQFEKKERGY